MDSETKTYIDEKFEWLAQLLSKHFTTIDERFDGVDEQLSSLRLDILHIRSDLDTLTEKVSGMQGYSREIDDLAERIRDIERHLGIKSGAHA